ncbi:acetate--CoA ligase family protein [Amycolatopsis thermalba]|uniref:Acetate--CoA ligase family protein n=1 Tax=Amycolatopsis thermalba TaxID=944492 RepID=A0ABY4NS57_9PSEU|nr:MULTISPECIES: acetate--CoA ligase family protein [Amycolatopsis]UQS22898.1 acetate--CoA ligase family protein [Amycolatopsis thermalba]
MTAADTVAGQAATGADDLSALWQPRSVAVVGASDNPAKWGYWLASGALSGRDRRAVHLVNHRGGRVCGVPAARSLREVGEPVDLTAVVVPATAVGETVTGALDLGSRAVLVITDGVQRLPGGPALLRDLARRARAAGARLLGPSSLGIVDSAQELRLAWGHFAPGPVAIITQSGQVGSELAHLLHRHGSGVSRFASVGVQADVTSEELLAGLAAHPGTTAVICYLEGVRDAAGFLSAARALREAGKPLVVLAAGDSAAGSAAARSHTGALTGSMDVLDAACRAAGAVRARTPAEAAALAHTLAAGVRPRGDRIVIVSDSGGQGALAADVATAAGLRVTPLGSGARARLAETLPAVPGNPVDLAGAGEQDLSSYAAVAEAVAPEAGAVVLTGYFGRFGVDSPGLREAECAVAHRLTRLARTVPVVVHSMAEDGPAVDVLVRGGIPVFADVETTLRAVAGCVRWERAVARDVPTPDPVGEGERCSYLAARDMLREAGIPVPEAGTARSADEAVALAASWPGATVLKADLDHKTEAGGVVLGLRTAGEVAAAHRDLTARLGLDSVVVERMDERAGVVEVLVGLRHDPVFGRVVVVSSGGVEAELWRDTVLELAPVDEAEATAMLARLRGHPRLLGWRGAPGVDIPALARAIAAVSRMPVATCEINPLRASADGVLAVDALVFRGHSEEEPA